MENPLTLKRLTLILFLLFSVQTPELRASVLNALVDCSL
jgi:hypothetical protein